MLLSGSSSPGQSFGSEQGRVPAAGGSPHTKHAGVSCKAAPAAPPDGPRPPAEGRCRARKPDPKLPFASRDTTHCRRVQTEQAPSFSPRHQLLTAQPRPPAFTQEPRVLAASHHAAPRQPLRAPYAPNLQHEAQTRTGAAAPHVPPSGRAPCRGCATLWVYFAPLPFPPLAPCQ